MNTTIIRKDFLNQDEFIQLHLDTKVVYFYLILSSQRNYLDVFKFNKHPAMLTTGVSKNSLEAGLEQLQAIGYIDVFNDYVGLLKGHVAKVGGKYGPENTARELASLPVDVRDHFNLDEGIISIVEPVKKEAKKAGPAPETIKSIIAKQPVELRESLEDFVADRIERKKAPTTRAVKGWIKKLNEMYPNSPQNQALVLQQSIERGWMGLFELKVEQQAGGGKFM